MDSDEGSKNKVKVLGAFAFPYCESNERVTRTYRGKAGSIGIGVDQGRQQHDQDIQQLGLYG